MLGADPRVAVVEDHMRLENDHDFPGCIGAFEQARYEVLALDETYDGGDRVHEFLIGNVTAFPDFEFRTTRISPSDTCVVVEGRFTGTHEGSWNGMPGTGRRVDFPMCLVFDFDGDKMVGERLYFDVGTPLRQIGLADSPLSTRGKVTMVLTHPVVILRALLRKLRRR